MRATRRTLIQSTSSTKNNVITKALLTVLVFTFAATFVEAKGTVVGDLILLGNVQRSGQQLTNDTSVFEGDSIHTEKASAGVVRIGGGRIELGESSEMEIVGRSPLRVMLKSGTMAFNVPGDTPFEIVT